MPTKKIQLRGISRTPSDRMSADGGLAESIGFETDMQELAVNVPATDVTTELGLKDEVQGAEVVYIHKTNDYCNYIAKNASGVGQIDGNGFHAFYMFETGESLKEIKSVGNTLILLMANTNDETHVTQRMQYVLYKDENYIDLGDEIPEPRIDVKTQTLPDEGYYSGMFARNAICAKDTIDGDDVLHYLQYNCSNSQIKNAKYGGETGGLGYNVLSAHTEMADLLRENISSAVISNLSDGALSFPIYLRYALKLYDGSYARHSAPILLDPNSFRVQDILPYLAFSWEYQDRRSVWYASASALNVFNPYKPLFSINNSLLLDDWKDIVSDVVVFATPQIELFSLELDHIQDGSPYGGTPTGESNLYVHNLTEEEITNKILESSLFYKIREWGIDEYVNLDGPQYEIEYFNPEQYGTDYPYYIDNFDYLEAFDSAMVTKERLSDDNGTNNKLLPNHLAVYNKRVIAAGADFLLYDGPYNLPSIYRYLNYEGCMIQYRIRTAGGVLNVIRQYASPCHPGPFLFYPDARCFEAVIYKVEYVEQNNYGIQTVTVPMKEHPYLNGSYYFKGFGKGTSTDCYSSDWYSEYEHTHMSYERVEDLWAAVRSEENNKENKANVLFQTDALNMFLFPAQQSFQGMLNDVAVITKPLSTGQFGYSSLYIFTDIGLWTIQINADGSLGKVDTVSQDVALPGTVCQLDQAVVFTTKKGVMLLTGSDLRCISDRMHGRHYKLDTSIYTLLTTFFATEWGELAEMAHEDMPFMEYMAGARTAYDYVGRRLLFFKETNSLPYIYAYMIETDSWHKVVMPAGYEFKGVLNSYPDTYIAADKIEDNDRYAAVMCFSNARSQDDYTRYKGMIITRPIDLDEDDVRKVLNRLFVRGSYAKEAQENGVDIGSPVKMLLLGSADGLTWQKLRSFRGGSYKLFRLVLLCQLTQAERISYVEAEFETRYTGRLR